MTMANTVDPSEVGFVQNQTVDKASNETNGNLHVYKLIRNLKLMSLISLRAKAEDKTGISN